MFLLRPPDIARVSRDLMPAVAFGRSVGLRHVVLLSVQGAGQVPVLPHAAAERWLRQSGLSWTFVRPSYFDQDLSGVFAPDIRERDEIVVPAGGSRTAFVDAHDVAEVAAAALLRPSAHTGRVHTPTGPALTYAEVAGLLSDGTRQDLTGPEDQGRPCRGHQPEDDHGRSPRPGTFGSAAASTGRLTLPVSPTDRQARPAGSGPARRRQGWIR